MPIQQKSPTTSSIGQGQPETASDHKTSIDSGIAIVKQFDALPSVGVSQTAPSPETARSNIDPILKGAFLKSEVTVPSPGDLPTLRTLQLWEGTVTGLRENGFIAVLSDKTNPDNPDERGEFSFDRIEISEEDQQLVTPGASFYWIIGTQVTRGKTVQNVSMVHFRRTPIWTERMLTKSAERVRGMLGEAP